VGTSEWTCKRGRANLTQSVHSYCQSWSLLAFRDSQRWAFHPSNSALSSLLTLRAELGAFFCPLCEWGRVVPIDDGVLTLVINAEMYWSLLCAASVLNTLCHAFNSVWGPPMCPSLLNAILFIHPSNAWPLLLFICSFINSFIQQELIEHFLCFKCYLLLHSFNRYLLRASCVPHTDLGSGDTVASQSKTVFKKTTPHWRVPGNAQINKEM
jgi:hypothetical protein